MESTKEAVERDVGNSGIGKLSGCGEHFDFRDRSGCGENFGFEEKCHVREQSDVEEQSDIEERSDFAMQSGFGDTLTISGQKTCDSSNTICRELKRSDLDTFVDFTSYSQASSCDMSSKFDDDVMSVNSEDVHCANKRNSVFEVFVIEFSSCCVVINENGTNFRSPLDTINTRSKVSVTEIVNNFWNANVVICLVLRNKQNLPNLKEIFFVDDVD